MYLWKSIKTITKRVNLKLINDKKVYQRCVNKPNFMSSKIFDKNFVAVHSSKTVLTLNKPIYVGFCISELTKLSMYKFHYDYVLKTFDKFKLLFADTDSLVYEIKGVLKKNTCLILVNIVKILFIMMIQIKKC